MGNEMKYHQRSQEESYDSQTSYGRVIKAAVTAGLTALVFNIALLG